jgi:hypothetical protein
LIIAPLAGWSGRGEVSDAVSDDAEMVPEVLPVVPEVVFEDG